MDQEDVPVVFAPRQLVKRTATGQVFEVIEWRAGQPVVLTPASKEWPRVLAALQTEES